MVYSWQLDALLVAHKSDSTIVALVSNVASRTEVSSLATSQTAECEMEKSNITTD